MIRSYLFGARLAYLSLAFSFFVQLPLLASPTVSGAAQCDCAQPISNGALPTASDCLKLLNVAVGIGDCSPCGDCVCRPSGGPATTATDALLCLFKAVGQSVSLSCPCDGGSTTTTTTLVPKDLNGVFDLTVSEETENCGDGTGPPANVQITLSQNPQGVVTLVSPTAGQLGLSNLVMTVVGCQLIVSFVEDEQGDGRTCLEGAIDIDTDSNSFIGDINWKFVGPIGTNCSNPAICTGTDRWSGTRD